MSKAGGFVFVIKYWKTSICFLFIWSMICLNIALVSAKDLNVSAKSCILIEASSGRVLYSVNEREQLPIASTTKIMSALLALEHGDLDTSFVAEDNAIMVEGSSMGLRFGDTVTLRDLCYGMLLPSGNDAANLAAVRIAGSKEAFAELMNQRAQEIGMTQTHFVTPSGLHNDDHYSTAYDMALLAQEALKNTAFVDICKQKKAKLTFGNPPYDRWLSNHNKLLDYYEGCIGMKTGFTKKAGRCLVSAVERDGMVLICVTLNDPNDWLDHANIFDYGFSLVQKVNLTPDLSGICANAVGATQDTIPLTVQELSVVLTAEEQQRLQSRMLLRPFYEAPIQQGERLGSYEYLLDGEVIASGDICAAVDILSIKEQKVSIWERIKYYFKIIFLK